MSARKSYYKRSIITFVLLIVIPYVIGLLLGHDWGYEGNILPYYLWVFILVIIFFVMTLIFEVQGYKNKINKIVNTLK